MTEIKEMKGVIENNKDGTSIGKDNKEYYNSSGGKRVFLPPS